MLIQLTESAECNIIGCHCGGSTLAVAQSHLCLTLAHLGSTQDLDLDLAPDFNQTIIYLGW